MLLGFIGNEGEEMGRPSWASLVFPDLGYCSCSWRGLSTGAGRGHLSAKVGGVLGIPRQGLVLPKPGLSVAKQCLELLLPKARAVALLGHLGLVLRDAGPPSQAFWDLSPCQAALPVPCPSPGSQR